MVNYDDEIKKLEEEISKTKYNKRTQHHVGLVKAKLAKLKEKKTQRFVSKVGVKKQTYDVRKTGDGTVIIVGFPSVGKSTLLNDLTNAESKTAAYAFTTLTVVPGVMEYEHAKIQILDVPGVLKGAAAGTGRGKEVLAVMRSADMALILVDVNMPEQYNILKKEIYDSGLRLNEKKPDVRIIRTGKGGINIAGTLKLTKTDFETIKDVARELGINNADIVIRNDIDVDQFIDVVEANKRYIPAITVLNKIDMADENEIKKSIELTHADLAVSATEKTYIDRLKELIFEKLNLVRIYLKQPGKEPDLKVPLIMFNGCSIKDVCLKLHKDFVTKFKFARVWGKSSKFPGQKFMLEHKLIDNDVLELHLR